MEYENNSQSNQIIRYAIIGAIAIVALALVISIVSALLPGKFDTRAENSLDWAVNDDGKMVFVFNGKKTVQLSDDITEELEMNYGYYYGISTNYNRDYAVVRTEGKENKDGEYKYGDLYVVNSKKYQKVADEVSEYKLSAFGDTLVYISDGDLYVVQLSKPTKAKKIDSDIDGISAISPDGKSFAYYTIDEKESDDEEEYTVEYDYFISKNNKKGEKFNKKDSEIFALSNGAKYVYYTKGDKVFVNDSKLADENDMGNYYSFNRDGSQMIYSAKNSKGEYKTYIVNKAGEKVAIGNGNFGDVLAPTGTYRSYCYNVASFAKCAIRVSDGDDSVYYYLKNVKSAGTKISALKNASNVQLLDDATTVLFTKKGDLRSINITKPTSDPKTYEGFEEDVSYFDASSDGKYLYVVDTDYNMYFVKSTKKAVKIAEDVKGFIVMNNGATYFLNDDDEFCYVKGTSKVKVVTDELDNVADYDVHSNVMTIVSEDQYGVVNGAKFKKLFDVQTEKNEAND